MPVRRIEEQLQVEAPQSQLVLPYQFVAVSKGEATPSVKNITRLKFANAAPINVTNLINGQEGQEVVILGDGNVTLIFDVTKIITNTLADKLLNAGYIYKLYNFDGIWYEQ